MAVDAFRIQNFMGFVDSGWIEIRPLTLLFGCNSSGKSAILRALLLLQQSLNSPPNLGPLLFVDEEGLDFGGYREMVYNHEISRSITITFRHQFTVSDEAWFQELPLRPGEEIYFLPEHERENEFSENRLVRALTELVDIQISAGQANIITLQTEVSFCQSHQFGQAALKSLIIRDEVDEEIVGLTFETSRWQVSSDFLAREELEKSEWQALEVIPVAGFFPYVKVAEDIKVAEEQLLSSYGSYRSLLGILYPDIRDFLNIIYLGPLRPEPRRFYYAAGQGRANRVRNRVVQAVIEAKQPANQHSELAEKYRRIQLWLMKTLKTTFDVRPIDPSADGITSNKHLYEIVFQEVIAEDESALTGVEVGIREVGSGLSQALPVLIEALFAPKGTLVIIEQPELHLHPRAQAELGDLFISAASQGVRFLIETHSEHLLLRLRRRLAETAASKVIPDLYTATLSQEQLKIYFIQRHNTNSSVQLIEINHKGDLSELPDHKFFSTDAQEILALTNALLDTMSPQ